METGATVAFQEHSSDGRTEQSVSKREDGKRNSPGPNSPGQNSPIDPGL